MIYPNTDIKFRITIMADDFSQRSDLWSLRVIDRFNNEILNLSKNGFIRDSIGQFYFDMEDVQTGEYTAITTIGIADDDFESGRQRRADKQIFLRVNLHECMPVCGCHCKTDGMEVLIERVWIINIDGGDYLAESNGTPILDKNGEKIYFTNYIDEGDEIMPPVKLNMTGEEFKQLVEGFDPNSEVNTIPELIHAMQGISDETTVKQEIKDETEDTYVDETETLYLDGEKPEE